MVDRFHNGVNRISGRQLLLWHASTKDELIAMSMPVKHCRPITVRVMSICG